MKKFLSILLTVLIVVTVGTVNVMAAEETFSEIYVNDEPHIVDAEDLKVFYYSLTVRDSDQTIFKISSLKNGNPPIDQKWEYKLSKDEGKTWSAWAAVVNDSSTYTKEIKGKELGTYTIKFRYQNTLGNYIEKSTEVKTTIKEYQGNSWFGNSSFTGDNAVPYNIDSTNLQKVTFTAASGYNDNPTVSYEITQQPTGDYFTLADKEKNVITVKEGTPVGTYAINVKASLSETENYAADSIPAEVTIEVRKAKISAVQNVTNEGDNKVVLTYKESETVEKTIDGYTNSFVFNGYDHVISNFATITSEAGKDTETYSILGLTKDSTAVENDKVADYVKLSEDTKKIIIDDLAPVGKYDVSMQVVIGDATEDINNYTNDGGTTASNVLSFTYTFTITKAPLSGITVVFDGDKGPTEGLTQKNRYQYKDSAFDPQVVMKIGNLTLVPGKDYTIGGDYQDKMVVGRYSLNIKPVKTSQYAGTSIDIDNYDKGDYESRYWYIYDNNKLSTLVTINGVGLCQKINDNYYVDDVILTYNTFEQIVKVEAPSSTIKYSTDGGKTYTSATPFSLTDVIINGDKTVGSAEFYYEVSRSGYEAIYGKVTVTMNKAVAYALPVYKEIDICNLELADYQINTNSKLTYKMFIIENKGDTSNEKWIEIENPSTVSTTIGDLYAGACVKKDTPISSSDVYPGPYYAGVRNKTAANVGITSNYEKIESYGDEAKEYLQQAIKTDKDGNVIYNTTETTKVPVLTEKLGAFVITADLSKATVDTNHQTYNGSKLTPVPEVSYTFKDVDGTDEKVVINPIDYQLNYYYGNDWFVNAGTYYYMINGIQNAKYITGLKHWNSFVIDPLAIEVNWTNKKMYYNGLHQQDDPTITNLKNNVLNWGAKDTCDVEFEYHVNDASDALISKNETINAGTYCVVIKGVKNPNYTVGTTKPSKIYEIKKMLIEVAFKNYDNANYLTSEVSAAEMIPAIRINNKSYKNESKLVSAEKEILGANGLSYAFYKYPYTETPTTDFSEKGMYALCVVIPQDKFATGNYQIQILQKVGVTLSGSDVTAKKTELANNSYVMNEFYVVDAYNHNSGTYGNGKELYGMIIKNKTEDGFDNASARYTDYEYFENLLETVETTNPTDPNFDLGEPKFVLTLNAKKVTSDKAIAKILEIANGKKYSAIEATPTMQYMVNGVVTPMSSLASEKYFLNTNTSLELTFPVDKKIDGNRRTYTLYHLVWDKDNEKYVVDGNVTKSWTVKDASSGKVTVTTSSTTSPFFIVWNDWTKESSSTTKTVAKAVVNTSLD